MQRLSQEALALLTTSDEIITSIETHGPAVATILEEKWRARRAPRGSGTDTPSPPDYLGHMLALRDGLVDSATWLSQADHTHVHQLASLAEAREERAGIFEVTYDKFSSARRTLDGLHGEGKAFMAAAIRGPTARTPKRLLRQIDVALPLLLELGQKPPKIRIEGVEVDPAAMAADVQSVAKKLRKAQAAFRRMLRVIQASRKEKARRMKEHQTNTIWTARIVEGYYRLAGEKELAARLRPAARRAGRPPRTAPETVSDEMSAPSESADVVT